MSLAAGIFIALCTQQQAIFPKINVSADIEAGPVSKVLAKISKGIDIKLSADPAFKNDVVVLRIKNVLIGEALDRLAVSVAGKWTQENGVWKLLPDSAKRSLEFRTEVAEGQAVIEKFITRISRRDVSGSGGEGGSEQEPEVSTQMRLESASLMKQIGAQVFASLLPGQRIVYSIKPTPMQRPLAAPTSLAEALVKGHNYFVNERTQTRGGISRPTNPDPRVQELIDYMRQGYQLYDSLIAERVDRILAVVSRPPCNFSEDGGSSMPNLDIQLFSQSGTKRHAMYVAVDETDASYETEKAVAVDNSPKLEYSEKAKQLHRYLDEPADAANYIKTPLTKNLLALAEALEKPAENEPLQIEAGELLLNYAKTSDVNLVACLPDIAGDIAAYLPAPTCDAVRDFLSSSVSLRGALKDGWMVAAPRLPSTARRIRLDRESLQSTIAKCKSKPSLNLAEIARFAGANPYGLESPILSWFTPFPLTSISTYGGYDATRWQSLVFFDRLTPNQQTLALNGGRISVGELSTPAKQSLNSIIFGLNGLHFETNADARVPAIIKDIPEFGEIYDGIGLLGPSSGTLSREPTQQLPTGISNQAYFVFTVTKTPCFSPVDAQGTMLPAVNSLDLATYSRMEAFSREGGRSSPLDISRFKLGERTKINCTLSLNADFRFIEVFGNDNYPASAQIYTAETLPNETRQLMISKIAAMAKARQMIKAGNGSAQPPPP